jgi:hypothetical protein
MIPRASACAAAKEYSSSAIRSTSSKRSRPASSAACSRVMFSSWPVCAFVDGVKIGSGSRSDSRSPSGSLWPQTSPLRR